MLPKGACLMLKMNKYRLVAILLVLIFLACAVPVSAQDDDDDDNSLSRFSRVLSMFTNSFYHSGDVMNISITFIMV